MLIELIYYSTPVNAALEGRISAGSELETSSGQTRKEFLLALSAAVGKSNTVITVGELDNLTVALSKGLGLPLEAIEWDKFGVEGAQDAALPKGALPLLVEHSVCGMLIESGEQCIIAVDGSAAERVYDDYIAHYLGAIGKTEVQPEPTVEPIAEEDPLVEKEPIIEEEVINPPEEEYDLFADMTEEDIDFLDSKPKRKSKLVAILCVILAVVVVAAGAFYIYTQRFAQRNAAEYYAELMKQHGELVDVSELPEQFSSTYLTRFGALYRINPDVIGTISIPELELELPIVTAVNKDEGYYDNHRFDGKVGAGGTPYIATAYDENATNPNLVIYGKNTDGVFAELERFLDKKFAAKVKTVSTDSILYGEDDWDVFSVMLVDGTGAYDYTDNFADFTSSEQVADTVKKALKLTKIDFGFTESDFDNVGLSSNFLTLVTDHSEEGKKLVIVARKAADATIDVSPVVSTPTESEPTTSEATESAAN